MQRVLGIACGVILLELTAILVYPRSATQEAVAKMGLALEKLAELNRMTWVQGPWESPSQNGRRRGSAPHDSNITDVSSAIQGILSGLIIQSKLPSSTEGDLTRARRDFYKKAPYGIDPAYRIQDELRAAPVCDGGHAIMGSSCAMHFKSACWENTAQLL